MINHSSPWITSADLHAVGEQMKTGLLAQGEGVIRFETAVADYCGYRSAIATSSGASALVLILLALGLDCGDEVIVPNYVCRSVYDAILFAGAKPVVCDTSGDWVMTPGDVKKVTSNRTKAIILVHLYGIDASSDYFKHSKIPVINDYCQAFGLQGGGGGSDGLGFCSFQATKCLATGEGGMALFDNVEIFEKASKIKRHRHPATLFSDFQAALGLSQLSRYGEMLSLRRSIASRYFSSLHAELIQGSKAIDFVNQFPDRGSVFFRFPIRVPGVIDTHIEIIGERYGIAVRRGVDRLLISAPSEKYKNSMALYGSTLSLPIYPSLDAECVSHVIASVNEYFSTHA